VSRGLGTHQRRILQALRRFGWVWLSAVSHGRKDRVSCWRAARWLMELGRLLRAANRAEPRGVSRRPAYRFRTSEGFETTASVFFDN